jgi:GNAT superfamily N-acetyltransferase
MTVAVSWVRAFKQPHPLRPAGLVLRAAEEADLVFLSDLYAEVRADELAPVPWPEAAKRAFLQQQFDLQHAHYIKHYVGADFLVIELDGQRIGRIYLHRTANDIRVMDVALVSTQRGRGLGSALFAELIEESEHAGVPISLHVEAENPANRLYQRLGFEHWEDRGVYQFLGRRPSALRNQAGGTD